MGGARWGEVSIHGYTYSGSNTIGDVAWYWDNSSGALVDMYSGRGTWPVGQKVANELGLYDMSGNVLEWCWDLGWQYSPRRVRGGLWSSDAADCAVAYRDSYYDPVYRNAGIGFRLARSLGN